MKSNAGTTWATERNKGAPVAPFSPEVMNVSKTTGIQKVADALQLVADVLVSQGFPNRMSVDEVLIPEQCATVTMGDEVFHVNVIKLTDAPVEEVRGQFGRLVAEQPYRSKSARGTSRDDPGSPFPPSDDESEHLKHLAHVNGVTVPHMMAACRVVETLINNLATSDVVTYFGKAVLESKHGLMGYKWDMAVDIAKGMSTPKDVTKRV